MISLWAAVPVGASVQIWTGSHAWGVFLKCGPDYLLNTRGLAFKTGWDGGLYLWHEGRGFYDNQRKGNQP